MARILDPEGIPVGFVVFEDNPGVAVGVLDELGAGTCLDLAGGQNLSDLLDGVPKVRTATSEKHSAASLADS